MSTWDGDYEKGGTPLELVEAALRGECGASQINVALNLATLAGVAALVRLFSRTNGQHSNKD